MSGRANKKLLDHTIAFTQSSYAYKDPYVPRGGVIYQFRNKLSNFMNLRSIENEFIDFKSYRVQENFKEIYGDLFNAYKRGDKVVLNRSLSQPMYEYSLGLLKEKSMSPYFKHVNGLTIMQARIYANQDHLLPED